MKQFIVNFGCGLAISTAFGLFVAIPVIKAQEPSKTIPELVDLSNA